MISDPKQFSSLCESGSFLIYRPNRGPKFNDVLTRTPQSKTQAGWCAFLITQCHQRNRILDHLEGFQYGSLLIIRNISISFLITPAKDRSPGKGVGPRHACDHTHLLLPPRDSARRLRHLSLR
jgi:hypothetical protein